MSLFAFALKKSLEKSEPYYDVTDKVNICHPDKKNFKSINIVSDIDVRINKGERFEIRVFSANSENITYVEINCNVSEDVLSINVLSRNNRIDRIYVSISIPKNLYCLKVNTSNTDIILKNIKSELLKLSSQNGDVQVYDSDFNDCKVKTNNGDINFGLNFKTYKIKAFSKLGDTILHDVKSDSSSNRSINCISEKGDIVIRN